MKNWTEAEYEEFKQRQHQKKIADLQEDKPMTFKLGKNIQVGQKVKTLQGWRKVLEVTEGGVVVKEGLIAFGQTIYGWRIK